MVQMKLSLVLVGLVVCYLNDSWTQAFLIDGRTPTLQELADKVAQMEQEILTLQSCVSDFCEVHWSKWSVWSGWSHCSGQCTNGYSGREQTRSRTRTCLNDPTNTQNICNGPSTESDTRPCNAVELYGCLNEPNTNVSDNSAFGLAYNFYDELAQATCTAALKGPAHAAAVRRNCATGLAADCTIICQHLGYQCFDELHVYQTFTPLQSNLHGQTDEGKQGLFMYRYFSCHYGTGGCGPNYCCCRW